MGSYHQKLAKNNSNFPIKSDHEKFVIIMNEKTKIIVTLTIFFSIICPIFP